MLIGLVLENESNMFVLVFFWSEGTGTLECNKIDKEFIYQSCISEDIYTKSYLYSSVD